MLPLKISGLGTYFPEQIENKDDFLRRGIDEDTINNLGIYERRLIGKDETVIDMEVAASKKAIANANLKADEIDLIISATLLPEMVGMPNSNILQNRLGAKNAAAFDIVQACCALIPGMIMSSNFIAMNQYKTILITTSTNWSVISNSDQASADFVLGDGAAAIVLTASSTNYGIISFDIQTKGQFYYNCGSRIGNNFSKKYYEKHDDKLLFFIDNDGVEGSASRFGRYLLTNGPSAFKAALKKANLTPDDIDCALIHGNVKPVVDGWIKGMKIPRERIPLTFDRYGNLSVVTILANLKEALDKNMIKKGDTVALISQGAGFSAGSIIMRWE